MQSPIPPLFLTQSCQADLELIADGVTVEKAKGIHCFVDPTCTRVQVQKKERDVLGVLVC